MKFKKLMLCAMGVAMGICLSLAVTACGSAKQEISMFPDTHSGVLHTVESGIPADTLGSTGDVCLVAEDGVLYTKTESGWVKTESVSCEVEGSTLTVTYADGSVGSYELAAKKEQSACDHSRLETASLAVVYPAECVVPGIGVRTCPDCHESFPEIIPASGDHAWTLENVCEKCGSEMKYTTSLNISYNSSKGYAIVQNNWGISGDIVIPYGYQGHPVKEISGYAFNGAEITSVEMPDCMETIGQGAFLSCDALTGTIKMPKELKTLSYVSFAFCPNITGLDFSKNNSLTTVGRAAFEDCSGLDGALELPATVEIIDEDAFWGCNLTGINLEDLENLTKIGDNAFYKNYDLRWNALPASLVEIGDYAFENCYLLEGDLVLPEGLQILGSSAFALDEWELGDRYDGGKITSVSLGNSLTSIGGSAFYGRTALQGPIKLPETLTSIGGSAFRGTQITGDDDGGLTIPASVTSIGTSAFEDTKLRGLHFEPDGQCTEIGSGAFRGCSELAGEINFPDELRTIGYQAFDLMNELSKVTAITFTKESKLETVGIDAFAPFHLIKSLVIPATVTSLADYSFDNCYSLKEIWNFSGLDIQAGKYGGSYVGARAAVVHTADEPSSFVTDDEGYVFLDAEEGSLLVDYSGEETDLVLPASTPEGRPYKIFDYALYYNSSIENVLIGTGVTGIGRGSFQSCPNLKSVMFTKEGFLGGEFASIDAYAFIGCPSLETLMIPGSTSPQNSNTIVSGDVSLKNVYVGFSDPFDSWVSAYLDWTGVWDLIGEWTWYSEEYPADWLEWLEDTKWWHFGEDDEIVLWN